MILKIPTFAELGQLLHERTTLSDLTQRAPEKPQIRSPLILSRFFNFCQIAPVLLLMKGTVLLFDFWQTKVVFQLPFSRFPRKCPDFKLWNSIWGNEGKSERNPTIPINLEFACVFRIAWAARFSKGVKSTIYVYSAVCAGWTCPLPDSRVPSPHAKSYFRAYAENQLQPHGESHPYTSIQARLCNLRTATSTVLSWSDNAKFQNSRLPRSHWLWLCVGDWVWEPTALFSLLYFTFHPHAHHFPGSESGCGLSLLP